MIDLQTHNKEALARTIERAKERNIIIPTCDNYNNRLKKLENKFVRNWDSSLPTIGN